MIPELPVSLVSSLERRLATAATATTSPFTGTQEIQDWGGEWWEYQITLALLRPNDGRRVSAFFAALGGVRGRFLFRDPSIEPPKDIGSGIVLGSNQNGNSLQTQDWHPAKALFQTGDFFSLGTDAASRTYQITEDVSSDAAGHATLHFIPRLREIPVDGAALEVINPKLALRLISPVPSSIGRAGKYQFIFAAREAL